MHILKFSTPTCVYCRVASPSIAVYALEHGATVQGVDAFEDTQSTEDRALCEQYQITGVPVVVVQQEGQEDTVLRNYHDIMNFVNNQS